MPLYKVPFSVRSFMDNDPEQVDFDQLPARRYARGFESILTHGDTLFIPSGWWHHMRYIDNGFALSQRAVPRSWYQRMLAANNLFLVRPVETALRKFGGEAWRDFKDKVAIRRGLALVRRMEALS